MRSALLPKHDGRRTEKRVRVWCYFCRDANWYMDLAVLELIDPEEIVCLNCIAETEQPQAWPEEESDEQKEY
jgi:hypothetical protein